MLWQGSTMTNGPRVGRITIDWVDAADESVPSGEFNFGWSIRCDPPIDDERTAALLQEILETM
jgi:hypothetical protein